MNSEIIDLSSGGESGEPSDHHAQTPRSPSTTIHLTSTSLGMEEWPEDKCEMVGQYSVFNSTQASLSPIIIDDDSSTEEPQSMPGSPKYLASPTMSEWNLLDKELQRSVQRQFGEVYPSFKSLRRLLFGQNPDDYNDSQSSGSATLESSSSQSGGDDTDITVPGSSPADPIDLSDTDDDLCVLRPGRRVSTVQDPRRRITTPRSTLAGEIDQVELNGEILRPSLTVKLLNGTYLRIEWIALREGQMHLWGRHLMGCNDHQWPPHIPKDEHELVWVPWMDHETDLNSVERHLPVTLMEVAGLCEVIFTNERRGKNTKHEPGAGLFCRLKATARKRPKISPTRVSGLQISSEPEFDQSVEYLTLDECDEAYGFESQVLRDLYRGCPTVPFGEGQVRYTGLPTVTEEDEDGSRPVVDLTVNPTAYLFGDAYCGAGGTSCGAKQAGLELKWACDLDRYAVHTYGMNFDAWIDHCSFNDLLTHPKEVLRVDIAHCSPPCQTFSPAHTIDCARDDNNSACIFSASNLVEYAHPRILTMEETAGLKERYKDILNRVIMDLIEAGYSVRWAVIDVLHYGVPQTRKRLIIIAAG